MSKTKTECRTEHLEREALNFARSQLTNGRITEEDVYAMFGKRRILYMNAIDSLDPKDYS